MKNLFITATFLFILVNNSFSQATFPENGPLYVDTLVPRIDIFINPDTLDWLYQEENLQSDIEFHAVFVFDNGTVRDTIDPVGFRLRGNTSRYSQKKSFKVSFNTFTKGAKYYGVEKLNLNGEHNDPSVIRSKVGWDILRKWNIPAPRANHVEVYINDDYYGLYISVEHIDEEFIKSRFTYNDGNLYKCLYPANLNYLDDNPDAYKFEAGDRRAYELKINEEADDYSDLAHFIDVLNNTSNDELVCKLDEVFNVYDYIKVIVFDILTGNWDGYIYNMNNFYLYHNTTTGKFEFIPYDIDNTLGIDWFGKDWETRNIYDWQQHGDQYRPLYERLMNTKEFRDQYTFYSKQLNDGMDFDSLKNVIAQRRDMIFPYITDDPYYPLDYGYTPDDFLTSYNYPLGGHVKTGLFPFIMNRISASLGQVEETLMKPVIKYIDHWRQSPSELWINAYAEVETASAIVEVEYKFNDGETIFTQMYDDGNHQDGDAGDLTYGISISEIPSDASVSYQITVTDDNNNTSTLPCKAVFVPASGSDNPDLFINEFMASNESTIADEHGDYDDWIELYNAGSESVWLGDNYLTDNITKPEKWQLPDAYIEPGEFLMIWADDEPEQGPFHATFKLSKDGEDIGLFNSDLTSIDEYVFGEQETDVSEGRFHDTEENWIFFINPTPKKSNGFTDISEKINTQPIALYPNPVSSGKVFFTKTTNYSVYNSMGQLVETGKNSSFFNISGYNKGLYIVVINSKEKIKLLIQ